MSPSPFSIPPGSRIPPGRLAGVRDLWIRTGARGGLLAAVLTTLASGIAARAAEWVPRMLLLDAALSGEAVVAVGERGTIARSTDQGKTWQRSESPTPATLTGVSFAPDAAANVGWAVGHDALILGTTDAGRTWTTRYQGPNVQDSLLDVIALDATHAIAVGAYGMCVVTADAGQTWTRRELTPEDAHLNRITQGPSGTLYVAGERGTLLRSVDRGATWQALPSPYEGSFYGVLPLEPTVLLAHGLRGRVYHSANDGETWTLVPTPSPVLYATAIRLRNERILLAGNTRTLAQSADQGRSFAASRATAASALAELLELPDGHVLGVGETGVTLFPSAP